MIQLYSFKAKAIYGMMIERVSLSIKNGWLDEDDETYIHYSIADIMVDTECGKNKNLKCLKELEEDVRLIERKKQGQGRPDMIYVKNFAIEKVEESVEKVSEVCNVNLKEFTTQTSISPECKPLEVYDVNPNNNTNINYINPILSIYTVDTNRILAKIDAFGKGMREATQQMANTFRTFADKEEVDYSQKEQKFSKTELAKKPWMWQKKVYESMVLHLDASIDKVEDLSRDVKLNRMKDKQVEEPNVDYSKEILPVGTVAEPSEYQYGAEAFEAAYPKMNQEKAMDVKAPTVPKTGKVR